MTERSVDPTGAAPGAAERMRSNDAVAEHLGLEIVAGTAGAATVRMTVTHEMTNGFGITHGGYVFLLADTAFAYACNGRGGGTAVAAAADIDFLEATREGDVLTAVAGERLLRGRAGIYDVRVTCDGRPVAEFRGRSRTVRDARSDTRHERGRP